MTIDLGTVLDTTPVVDTGDAGDAGAEEVVETDPAEGGDDAGTDTDTDADPNDDAGGDADHDDTAADDADPDAAAVPETDGRKVEASIRKALSELKKTDPAAAKQLQSNYFENKAFRTEFPTVQDARNAKLAIENLGGDEGIEQLNAEVADFRSEISQFAAGDPALLKKLQAAHPESFVTMATNALDMLQGMDEKSFVSAVTPTIAHCMEKWGFNNAVTKLASYIKEGKGQEAYDIVKDMAQELGNIKTSAEQRKSAPKIDPKAEALTKREQELTQREEKQYQENMGREFGPANEAVVSKLIAPMVKSLGLKGEGLRDFKNTFYGKVFSAIKADKVFQKQAQALIAKGDAVKAGKFLAAKFAELAPGIFLKYRNSMYPNLAKAASNKTSTEQNNGNAGPKAVPGKMYTREQVDLRATPSEFVITGQAYLKGSKTLVKYQQ